MPICWSGCERATDSAVYVPGFDRDLEQPLAAALVVMPGVRLVVTEGNYLLLDGPDWVRARRAMDRVWFVDGDEQLRTSRLIARHVEFGKSETAARAWVAEVDERNAARVAPTAAAADRVIVERRERLGDFGAIAVVSATEHGGPA